MEYDLTCKYPLTFAEFNWMLSKIMVRAIVDKLQKKGTENDLMTYNLGAEGVFIMYRYQPRTETNRRDCLPLAFAFCSALSVSHSATFSQSCSDVLREKERLNFCANLWIIS